MSHNIRPLNSTDYTAIHHDVQSSLSQISVHSVNVDGEHSMHLNFPPVKPELIDENISCISSVYSRSHSISDSEDCVVNCDTETRVLRFNTCNEVKITLQEGIIE